VTDERVVQVLDLRFVFVVVVVLPRYVLRHYH
jgi:hypothetical protein